MAGRSRPRLQELFDSLSFGGDSGKKQQYCSRVRRREHWAHSLDRKLKLELLVEVAMERSWEERHTAMAVAYEQVPAFEEHLGKA